MLLAGTSRKACQVSEWPRHKKYHKSLEKERDSPCSQRVHTMDSLALSDDRVEGLAGSGSRETRDANGMTALLLGASDKKWREGKKIILNGADSSVADDQGLCTARPPQGAQQIIKALIELLKTSKDGVSCLDMGILRL